MAESLAPVPETPPLPDFIVVSAQPGEFRLSPNELRRLKDETGRTLTELVGDDADEADRMQALVWLKLRRDGYRDVTWDEAGDVEVEYSEPTPDPTNAARSMTSPDSATTGE